jgi:Phage Tail Collar Domain
VTSRRRALACSGAAVGLFALVVLGCDGQRGQPTVGRTDAEIIDELKASLLDLKLEQTRLAEQHSRLSRSVPPVGSVVALAGVWPPRKADKGRWTEDEIGWLLCDGRKIEGGQYAALRAVLGEAVLPDYRGCFLRGIDRGTDGRTSGRDKGGVRTHKGPPQCATTQLPVTPFQTGAPSGQLGYKEPQVVHEVDVYPVMPRRKPRIDLGTGPYSYPVSLTTVKDGKVTDTQTHPISGGDPETRPVNMAVNWIIRFKP